MWTSLLPTNKRNALGSYFYTIALITSVGFLSACTANGEDTTGKPERATIARTPSSALENAPSANQRHLQPAAEAKNPSAQPMPENAHRRRYLQGNSRHGWEPGQLGKPEEFWNRRADRLPVNSESAAVTRYLAHVSRNDENDPRSEFFGQFDLGKKANGENYSFHILEADSSTPRYDFTLRLTRNGYPADEFYAPHCDRIAMPVPPNGRIQGEADYRCTGDGDCHLYVVDTESGRLYEQWRADNPGPNKLEYAGGCTNVWDLSEPLEDDLRGLSCTSANAAGLPYIPLLVTPGEIKAGVIRHALAFTLPNGWVERDTYARPATHNPLSNQNWGAATKAPGQPMRYGSHFRLDQGFRISPQWPASLRVILQALKDYGMYHIDGGPRMIITSNDAFSEHSWNDPDIALNPYDMTGIAKLSWENFELVSTEGAVGSMTRKDCQRRTQVEKARDVR